MSLLESNMSLDISWDIEEIVEELVVSKIGELGRGCEGGLARTQWPSSLRSGVAAVETQISLFSQNEALVRFMQASIAEGLGKEFTLEVKAPGQIPSGQDLCIWDFVPGETIFPQWLRQTEWRKHLVLLHRKDLGVLRSLVGVSDVNMLLKPVTRAALQAFLAAYGIHLNLVS